MLLENLYNRTSYFSWWINFMVINLNRIVDRHKQDILYVLDKNQCKLWTWISWIVDIDNQDIRR
jgi:hypothetical protein